MKKEYLLSPGPTPVPTDALLSMARPIFHHRTPQYQALFKEVNEGLKYVFQTNNDVLTFASSGTGAMEASVVNFLSPRDKALVVRGGKFGERFTEICEAYGVEAIPIDVQWGNPVDPGLIERSLLKNKGIKAVYTTLCETSTGVLNDIEAISKIVSRYDEAILVVDAISGLGADDLKTDDWKIDVVVSGSQKGLMIPPGLAFFSVSQKGWARVDSAKCPRFYFDLKSAKKAYDNNDTPFTPAISLVIALSESLKIIKKETLANIFLRHRRLADATRWAVQALGLELFAKAPSNAVTAVQVPQGIDGKNLVKLMRDKYGVTIAGGQGELKGKTFRIAHLGYMVEFDVIVAIAALEMALKDSGYGFSPGAGLVAAQEAFAR
ncbi:MAG: alanine--glyoxylate aminotransferase family protein [Candidatus Omnitrophica bacterium]|nr:alanine--glyoxylate aminotransferase family protein [Candidatus Omnitrophota bacterium]